MTREANLTQSRRSDATIPALDQARSPEAPPFIQMELLGPEGEAAVKDYAHPVG